MDNEKIAKELVAVAKELMADKKVAISQAFANAVLKYFKTPSRAEKWMDSHGDVLAKHKEKIDKVKNYADAVKIIKDINKGKIDR